MNKIELDIGKLAVGNNHANESFKALRTNILFCGEDTKIISLTSATPNEGKTTVAINLAVSMAELGKRVLYIDADLRKSKLKQIHNLDNISYGLSHFLSGIKKFDEVVCSTNISNLSMVLAGIIPPNPSELLSSKYFKALLIKLKDIYDYIFIDTPSIGNITDTSVIARESDGIIIVIEADLISYKFEQKVLNDLKKSGCKILGAILNKVNMDEPGYYGRYYRKYFGNDDNQNEEK